MKKFYQEPARLAMRAAMTLALMVLTTATAWADDSGSCGSELLQF